MRERIGAMLRRKSDDFGSSQLDASKTHLKVHYFGGVPRCAAHFFVPCGRARITWSAKCTSQFGAARAARFLVPWGRARITWSAKCTRRADSCTFRFLATVIPRRSQKREISRPYASPPQAPPPFVVSPRETGGVGGADGKGCRQQKTSN